jgi:hypothetical protein
MKSLIEVLKCSYLFIITLFVIMFTPLLLIKADALATGELSQTLVDGGAVYMFVLCFLYCVVIAKSKPEDF